MVKIAILTSSRADFGVYLPLLSKIVAHKGFSLSIIAFGTHLSDFHGYTVNEIVANGFEVKYKIPTAMASDSVESISTSAALCSLKFSSFWAGHKDEFDIILCLGDRYEMFAAVSAGAPYNLKFAHFYGGDTSLGAIDNVYRDCLTHMSIMHFTSTAKCANRVRYLKPNDPIEVVGILSLDDITSLKLLTVDEFKNKWNINLTNPTILVTFHPETIEYEKNQHYAEIIFNLCEKLIEKYQIVITMSNADTNGYVFQEKFKQLKNLHAEQVFLIKNFGRTGYFTCMKFCSILLGNTSSGLSEAPSFQKYAVNVGDRQKGRETSNNVISVDFDVNRLIAAVDLYAGLTYEGINIYNQVGSSDKIVDILENV